MSTTTSNSSSVISANSTTSNSSMDSNNTTSTNSTSSVTTSSTASNTTSTTTTKTSSTSPSSNDPTSSGQAPSTPPPPGQSSSKTTQSSDTTQSSSPGPGSANNTSPAPVTTGDSDGESSSNSSTSTTLTSPLTTVFHATVTLIDGNGSPFVTVVESTATLPPGSVIPENVTVEGNSNARARSIAGGVVGSVAGLTLLGFLLFFFLRHRRRKNIQKGFDGNFDPVATTDKQSSTVFSSVRRPFTHGSGPSAEVIGVATLPDVATDDELLDDRTTGTTRSAVSPFIAHSRSSIDGASSERPLIDSQSIKSQTSGSSSFNPYTNTGYPSHRMSLSALPFSPSSFSYPKVSGHDRRTSWASSVEHFTS